ncbi:hypothetical protein Psuf_042110 [Phytohabitans suffuscus]|uniref:Haloacid dehalogenase n=1 Tax=Phytohabitans suffuscus TaxID=624315 RepID=A0A6F8YLR0_9ACTN|nr:HAD family hydrolase [Phytohabitans suffuscus]BCB86898.1 hypothetical protein Psuf_042110 [Phytohabitans suffuscus]
MKLFVWDLHGVLEQGNDRVAIDISNEVLKRFGHRERFTYRDGATLYGRKWYEYFEWLLPDASRDYCVSLQDASFDLSERDVEFQRRWLAPAMHAWDVLAAISLAHSQVLISNTRPANLEMFVKMLGLEQFFIPDKTALAVDGHGPEGGRTKQDTLRDYLSQGPGAGYSEIVVIGDSPSDMMLTEVAGV